MIAGSGRIAAKASRMRDGSELAVATVPLCAMRLMNNAEMKNDAALSAKKVLIGAIASNPAAAAHPPIDSALVVAPSSPLASSTFARSTSAGSIAL